MWNERDMAVYLSLIDRQINALNLFLQAIQWYCISPNIHHYITFWNLTRLQ